MPRTRALALALTAALLVAPSGIAFHSDLDPILEDTGANAASWGIRVDREDTGDIAIDVEATEPPTDNWSHASVGFGLWKDGTLVILHALTVHNSPDRSTSGLPATEGSDGGITVDERTRGDLEDLPDTDVAIRAPTGSSADASPSAHTSCPWMCLGIESFDREPGSHRYLVWTGGVGDIDLTVRAEGEAEAVANAGDAVVLGDPDLSQGDVNVQEQRTVCADSPYAEDCPVPAHNIDARLGVKVMDNVSTRQTVNERLYGFWAAGDFKLTCQFLVGFCYWFHNAYEVCSVFVPGDCDPTELSWHGPDDGAEGGTLHSFAEQPPGEYVFTVDRKIDLYGPSRSGPDGTWIQLGENYSFLTFADVTVPPPP